jgi:hypothetical protein
MSNKILTEKEWVDSVQQIWDECIRQSIEEQIKEAVAAEREACAKVADGYIGADPISATIRARGK